MDNDDDKDQNDLILNDPKPCMVVLTPDTKPERGAFLSVPLYKLILQYLMQGVKPPMAELVWAMEWPGMAMDPRAHEKIKYRFKSWASRMQYDNGYLVHKQTRKIIIPKESFTPLIWHVHCSGFLKHLSSESTFTKIGQTYSTGKRNFGLTEEHVREIVRLCNADNCCSRNRSKVPFCHNLSRCLEPQARRKRTDSRKKRARTETPAAAAASAASSIASEAVDLKDAQKDANRTILDILQNNDAELIPRHGIALKTSPVLDRVAEPCCTEDKEATEISLDEELMEEFDVTGIDDTLNIGFSSVEEEDGDDYNDDTDNCQKEDDNDDDGDDYNDITENCKEEDDNDDDGDDDDTDVDVNQIEMRDNDDARFEYVHISDLEDQEDEEAEGKDEEDDATIVDDIENKDEDDTVEEDDADGQESNDQEDAKGQGSFRELCSKDIEVGCYSQGQITQHPTEMMMQDVVDTCMKKEKQIKYLLMEMDKQEHDGSFSCDGDGDGDNNDDDANRQESDSQKQGATQKGSDSSLDQLKRTLGLVDGKQDRLQEKNIIIISSDDNMTEMEESGEEKSVDCSKMINSKAGCSQETDQAALLQLSSFTASYPYSNSSQSLDLASSKGRQSELCLKKLPANKSLSTKSLAVDEEGLSFNHGHCLRRPKRKLLPAGGDGTSSTNYLSTIYGNNKESAELKKLLKAPIWKVPLNYESSSQPSMPKKKKKNKMASQRPSVNSADSFMKSATLSPCKSKSLCQSPSSMPTQSNSQVSITMTTVDLKTLPNLDIFKEPISSSLPLVTEPQGKNPAFFLPGKNFPPNTRLIQLPWTTHLSQEKKGSATPKNKMADTSSNEGQGQEGQAQRPIVLCVVPVDSSSTSDKTTGAVGKCQTGTGTEPVSILPKDQAPTVTQIPPGVFYIQLMPAMDTSSSSSPKARVSLASKDAPLLCQDLWEKEAEKSRAKTTFQKPKQEKNARMSFGKPRSQPGTLDKIGSVGLQIKKQDPTKTLGLQKESPTSTLHGSDESKKVRLKMERKKVRELIKKEPNKKVRATLVRQLSRIEKTLAKSASVFAGSDADASISSAHGSKARDLRACPTKVTNQESSAGEQKGETIDVDSVDNEDKSGMSISLSKKHKGDPDKYVKNSDKDTPSCTQTQSAASSPVMTSQFNKILQSMVQPSISSASPKLTPPLAFPLVVSKCQESLAPVPYPTMWWNYQAVANESSGLGRMLQAIVDMKDDIRRSSLRDLAATDRVKKKINYVEELLQQRRRLISMTPEEAQNYLKS